MGLKWIILIVIVVLASIVFCFYYFTFYKKPKVFKTQKKLIAELNTIDSKEKKWIIFNNTHIQNQKNKKWLLFDSIIITNSCMYFINDITTIGKILEDDSENDEWEAAKDGMSVFFDNPIKKYNSEILSLFKQLDIKFEYKIILLTSNESYDVEYNGGFCLRENEIIKLREIIKEYEVKHGFSDLITMNKKKEFMLKLQDKVFYNNKKNILDVIDAKKL